MPSAVSQGTCVALIEPRVKFTVPVPPQPDIGALGQLDLSAYVSVPVPSALMVNPSPWACQLPTNGAPASAKVRLRHAWLLQGSACASGARMMAANAATPAINTASSQFLGSAGGRTFQPALWRQHRGQLVPVPVPAVVGVTVI